MYHVKTVLLSLFMLGLVCSFAFAAHHTPEDRGKALFNEAKFAGGSTSCNSCHPDGKGLEKAAHKKEFHIMGAKQSSLEEAVNACIVGGNKGKAIDIKSDNMKDMAAYIKSLGMKEMHHEMPMKKKAPGY